MSIKSGIRTLYYKLLGKKHLLTPPDYINHLKNNGIRVRERMMIFGDLKSILIDVTRPSLVSIGNDVSINENFKLLTHDYATKCFLEKYDEFVPSSGKVTIGNNVSFGMDCTVLKGVTIGDNCFIGAGSLVTKDIPANSVAVGRPARVVCTIDEYFERRKVECEQEAFEYARSIKERFGRMPVASDFWEEFFLFVDASNVDEYLDQIPIRRQLGSHYDAWLKKHKAKYNGLDDFLNAVFSN